MVVERWVSLADADGAHRDAEVCHARRHASVTHDHGVVEVHARGGGLDAAIIAGIFARFCDAEFHADWDAARATYGDAATAALLARSDAQRRFDALRAIFERAAAQHPDATPAEPLVNLIVDATTVADLLHHGDDHPHHGASGASGASGERGDRGGIGDPRWRRCETSDGVLVPAGDIVAAMWWGQLRRVIVDTAGVTVDMGRKTRLFTGAARDAVLLQSSRCVWPGCLLPSGRCQADHLHPWSRHGPSDQHNGAPKCAHHNRWSTRGYTTWRDEHGHWHTHRPDGTPI